MGLREDIMYDVDLDDICKTESLMRSMEEFEIKNFELMKNINLHNDVVDVYEILEDELLYSYLGNRTYTDLQKEFLLGQIIQLKSYILNSKKGIDLMLDEYSRAFVDISLKLSNTRIKNKEIQSELSSLGKFLGTSDSGKEIFSLVKSRSDRLNL